MQAATGHDIGFAPNHSGFGLFGNVSLCVPIRYRYDLGSDLNWPAIDGLPSGLMSLFDMMNFCLREFALGLRALSYDTLSVQEKIQEGAFAKITDAERRRIEHNLEFGVARYCRQLNLESAVKRLERTFRALRSTNDQTYETIEGELITLYEAIEDDLKTEYFYHYPREKALLVVKNSEWTPTFRAFPSQAKPEAERGIDCYGLGHNVACIFHMMRVAELGMRALARERKVTFPHRPLEWAEWENVINLIDTKAKAASADMTRGPALDAARAFYTAAIAQLRAFKETRNRIMHMRGGFDELDARRAMTQVRDFMNGLSVKIGEKTRAPIRRWP